MSGSEDSDDHIKDLLEIKNEIQKRKTDPATSGMFVSGWDDADADVDVVKDPKGTYHPLTLHLANLAHAWCLCDLPIQVYSKSRGPCFVGSRKWSNKYTERAAVFPTMSNKHSRLRWIHHAAPSCLWKPHRSYILFAQCWS